jgi:hypothetical protein
MSSQEVGSKCHEQEAKITSHGNRGVLLQRLWRRRGLFKFLAPAPLSWPAHLAYNTVNNLPIHSA